MNLAHSIADQDFPVENESALDLGAFAKTPLMRTPYEYMLVEGFVRGEALKAAIADFPEIKEGGSFPLGGLHYGPAFARILTELRGDALRKLVEEKFQVDLTGRPTIITVRGNCRAKDGKVHTDTESKIISVLLYMNGDWQNDGGRLRLLNSDDIHDVAVEVPPVAGSLLMFRRSDHSFHGHLPHVGKRQVIQMNWVTHQKFVDMENRRHGLSSRIKQWFGSY